MPLEPCTWTFHWGNLGWKRVISFRIMCGDTSILISSGEMTDAYRSPGRITLTSYPCRLGSKAVSKYSDGPPLCLLASKSMSGHTSAIASFFMGTDL